MGHVTLYIDPYASYYYFRDDILARTSESYVSLLPVNRAVRHFKREIITHSGSKALFDPPVHTFNSFIRLLNKKLPGRKKLITSAMKLVILQDLLNRHETELDGLQLASLLQSGSTITLRLEQMLTELTHFGYQLDSFDQPPPGAEQKYSDFAGLIKHMSESYGKELVDETSVIVETMAALDSEDLNQVFPGLECLYISGYGIYTPLMLEFISKLKAHVDIHICLTYSDTNQQLFKHTQNAYEAIKRLADTIKTEKYSAEGLESVLFNDTSDKSRHLPGEKKYFIQAAQNKLEEISFIASKIKCLHHQHNIPLHRIGVTFPNLETYAPLIRSVFKSYHIPLNLSTGFALSQSPLIQSFLKVLGIVVNRYESEGVFELLRLPFIKIEYRQYISVLRDVFDKLRLNHFSANWIENISDTIRKEYEDQEKALFQLIDSIENLLGVLKGLEMSFTPADFQTKFMQCLQDLGIILWYEGDEAPLSRTEREREFRAFNKFIKLINELIWILQYNNADEVYSPSDYLSFLKLIIQNATYNVREWPDYGVQIMPRLEIQSVPVDVLFVGGLVEGVFPRKILRDIFFNDLEREYMGLNSSDDLIGQDRFLFFQLLTHTADSVYLSYPHLDQETKQIRSTFLDNLSAVTSVSQTEVVSPESLLNRNEILIDAGRKLHTDETLECTSWLNLVADDNRKFWKNTLENLYRIFSRRNQTVFEGELTLRPEVLAHLNNKSHRQTFSVTALESYSFCPMQYFLERILKLKREEETEETISALERGALIHQILFRFYSELKSEKKHNEPWHYLERLVEIAHEEFSTLPYNGFLWDLEQEDYFGSGPGEGLWSAFLDLERKDRMESGFIPNYFELAFGRAGKSPEKDPYSSKDPLTLTMENQQVGLAGKIDRIDVNSKGLFRVVDYKTGSAAKKIKKADILSGNSLQLPVYLAAAKSRFETKGVDLHPTAAMYAIISDAENCENRIVLEQDDFAEVSEKLIENVFVIVSGIQSGRFVQGCGQTDRIVTRAE
jgi:ATP-dependent helicase/DNAse subunit B